MNLDALWHDLECGGYGEDLPLWRELAADAGGPVLDVGAGTGRVTLDLAARGVPVVALDADAALLDALRHRAVGLAVKTVVADARDFAVGRRFALVIVPMQTLQLLGGPDGRAAFLRCALDHLEPGGLVAAALADAMDCFDEDHPLPPPPAARDIVDVRYASQLLAVVEDGDSSVMHRRREIIGPGERYAGREVVLKLDRVSADEVAAEAARAGLPQRAAPPRAGDRGVPRVDGRRPARAAPRELARTLGADLSGSARVPSPARCKPHGMSDFDHIPMDITIPGSTDDPRTLTAPEGVVIHRVPHLQRGVRESGGLM